jgi:trehalose 6-phosphate synthase
MSSSILRSNDPNPRPHGRTSCRLLLLTARLPVPNGAATASGADDLTSALSPLLGARGGVWIGGWPEPADGAPELGLAIAGVAGAIQQGGYSLRPVALGEDVTSGDAEGFAREVVWPLFHDQPGDCRFEPAYWQAYRRVGRHYARVVARAAQRAADGDNDLVWVHDPLLAGVAGELARQGAAVRTAFFLHTPFPGLDLYRQLPWRSHLLADFLAFRQLGFQTERDLENFLVAVHDLLPTIEVTSAPAGGFRLRGRTRHGAVDAAAGAFPVGIDFAGVAERAARPEVAAKAAALTAAFRNRRIVLAIDPLERNRGIGEKLRAWAELLAARPAAAERVSLLLVVLPGAGTPRQRALKAEIEGLVGAINGRFGSAGWVPVHYLHRHLEGDDLLAHYQAADVALFTPLKEGMSLAAKQLCAARRERPGALVLSEQSGAAPEMAAGALLVNPFDVQAMARALKRALEMQEDERAARMRTLRQGVRENDVFAWADSILAAVRGGGAPPLLEPAEARNWP